MAPLAVISLLFVMLALAAVPSASVALVVIWSATHGLRNGVAVALDIVLVTSFLSRWRSSDWACWLRPWERSSLW